jgi:hypothetical protein
MTMYDIFVFLVLCRNKLVGTLKPTLIQTPVAEVRITTRQLAKCEWNSGLASKNTNPLASLARDLFPYLSVFLASCFLRKCRTTRQFGECLEKLIHTPARGYWWVQLLTLLWTNQGWNYFSCLRDKPLSTPHLHHHHHHHPYYTSCCETAITRDRPPCGSIGWCNFAQCKGESRFKYNCLQDHPLTTPSPIPPPPLMSGIMSSSASWKSVLHTVSHFIIKLLTPPTDCLCPCIMTLTLFRVNWISKIIPQSLQ